eukprot:11561379-Alexandrium_andersonii.AAC.1
MRHRDRSRLPYPDREELLLFLGPALEERRASDGPSHDLRRAALRPLAGSPINLPINHVKSNARLVP